MPQPTAPTAAAPRAAEVVDPFRRTADGTALPDPALTPGAAFPDADQAVVCAPAYLRSTSKPRKSDKADAYQRYAIPPEDENDHVVDRLVPVGLGGDNSAANLWPQPRTDRYGAQQKDLLEERLRELVCSGALPLEGARQEITTDWRAAYDRHVGLDPASVVTIDGGCALPGEVRQATDKEVLLTCTATDGGRATWQRRG
ncbi:hypothetical protein GTQ99_10140 [Kineococcus sp. T13]|nr:hypothetical protein [Kineococcus vitellinus]